ncbi:uncharacterized protein LOC141812149 [Curcuma longa]|uniref:uncharacterized protein LOC141812149 n=1 Tax=Curcuma longa TaxID=136217 RepID=UPI003D9EE7CA
MPREPLWIYLSASDEALGSVLVKHEGQTQLPIYFASHLLKDAETRYTSLEKLALALTLMARRLRPYFLSHPIVVLTNSGLGRILLNLDAFERLVKWTTELSEYDIQYLSRTAIKVQALADFLTEITGHESTETWKVFVDGSANKKGSGVGVTNNEAEYEAVLAGLQAAWHMGASKVVIHSDSQLVDQQIKGTFEVHNERLKHYADAVDKLKVEFQQVIVQKVPRADNQKTDELAKLDSSWIEELPDILWVYRTTPRNSTDLTPFHLVYGGKVVVLIEIGCASTRIESYTDADANAAQRAVELDLIIETQD